MCIQIRTKIETYPYDLTAYKVVDMRYYKDRYFSSLAGIIWTREPEAKTKTIKAFFKKLGWRWREGVPIEYKLGEKVVSKFETTAGLYVFTELETAINNCRWKRTRRVLECRIPAGTRVLYGNYLGKNRIDSAQVECLIPEKVADEDNYSWF